MKSVTGEYLSDFLHIFFPHIYGQPLPIVSHILGPCIAHTPTLPLVPESNEDAMLKQALEMSLQPEPETASTTPAAPPVPDFSMMSEEEQIAYAMQMSMQPDAGETNCNSLLPLICRWVSARKT